MSSKFNFTLKNIEHKNIIERYSLYISKEEKNRVTRLTEISSNNDTNNYIKTDNKYSITMLDHLTSQKLPDKTSIYCFWCRHPFDTIPLGCPIKYMPKQIEKKYFSEIHKENYTILQNTTKNSEEKGATLDYYETDGIFCSFNCCMSFVYDNIKNPMYSQSQSLIGKLYMDLYNIPPYDIKPAPHWRLLKDYGGNMTIDDYRSSFSKVTYEFYAKIREIPRFKPVGWIFTCKN